MLRLQNKNDSDNSTEILQKNIFAYILNLHELLTTTSRNLGRSSLRSNLRSNLQSDSPFQQLPTFARHQQKAAWEQAARTGENSLLEWICHWGSIAVHAWITCNGGCSGAEHVFWVCSLKPAGVTLSVQTESDASRKESWEDTRNSYFEKGIQ